MSGSIESILKGRTTLEYLLEGKSLEESLAHASKVLSGRNRFAAEHVYRVKRVGTMVTTQLYPERTAERGSSE